MPSGRAAGRAAASRGQEQQRAGNRSQFHEQFGSMLTDWSLIRRLAYELEAGLRGRRLTGAGVLDDGRVALVLRGRSDSLVLAVDPFASPPLVSLERDVLGVAAAPGFVRVLAGSLRGMMLAGVGARRGDRLVQMSFRARSRFGIEVQHELFLELVPRFGNVVLVKDGRTVAALKEFTYAQNPRRAVAAGFEYVPAPLPPRGLLPRIAAQSGYTQEAFVRRAESEAAMTEPLYVYRRGGELVQASVVPLRVPDAVESREAALLELFSELRAAQGRHRTDDRLAQRRRSALRSLNEREAKLRRELEHLAAKRRRIDARDELRAAGEEIFATLHLLEAAQREAAKERAAALFAQYKRLGKAIAHVEERERAIAAAIEANDVVRWELERVSDEDLAEVEAAIAHLGRGSSARRMPDPQPHKRKRAPLEFRTASGSRIRVGRSPAENAELTFRVARPNDLWFHARNTPGAHVILARDDRDTAPAQDIASAAALAAYHSKARSSGSVAVDYTARKNVRKQREAPAGLVWYMHAKTIVVEPRGTL
jgi:predicted ribosome quality control (RQC) complex YloA/Tae2 family protein